MRICNLFGLKKTTKEKRASDIEYLLCTEGAGVCSGVGAVGSTDGVGAAAVTYAATVPPHEVSL